MNNFNNILCDISKLVKINSEQTAPEEGAPFGRGAREALDCFLSLAKSFGFETHDIDGYAGEVIFGEGEEFAILAHLDVVPAGSGWTHEPFGGEIDHKNRRVWGRGTMDDKGPAVITLHALKALKDEGFTPKRKIKLIVGCNEENGWECINYYRTHAHMPDEGFSPDADFPVIFAEKGILQLRLKFPVSGNFKISGGERANMVCDRCDVEADGVSRTFRGKSAHGSTPEKGVNAIAPALSFLGLDDIKALLFDDGFHLSHFADETGCLTFSPNVIERVEDSIFVTVDMRYPATIPQRTLLSAINSKGVEYEILHEQLPLYNDVSGKLIQTLCSVYNEVTGKDCKPVAIGGGTYARALKNGAAFGPEEEGEENTIHQPDEYITFEKIEKCYKIYKLAIARLTA